MSSKWDPSKWELHRLYAKHPDLRKLLPPTSILTLDSLSHYLDQYDAVYIKGKNEHTGLGIIKAWKNRSSYRYVKIKGEASKEKYVNDLYQKVKSGRRHRSVLVQKAIDLARIDDRPFTIRLMLMRDGKRKWQYAGMLAKVSGKDSIVSNIRRGGGYAATVDEAMAKSLGYGPERIERFKKKLIRTGFDIVDYAVAKGYRTHEVALDLGVDKKGKIWIVEVNLCYPSYKVFDRLEDKTYYNRVKELAAAYKERRKS
jgi:uncharacterized circularly permuted ATP-grasp superfamily protein